MNLSLVAAAVLYPLLQGAWQTGPLPAEYASSPNAPSHLEDQAVKTQYDLAQKAQDPLLRSALAKDLAKASNPEAVKVLERLAKAEKDSAVRQDFLSALLALEPCAAPSFKDFLKELLKSPAPNERALAAALLLNASQNPSELLDFLASEKTPFIHSFLWPRLAPYAQKASRKQLEQFLDSPLPAARAGSVAAIVGANWDSNQSPALTKAVSDQDATVRFALASSLAASEGGSSLLEKLAKDSNASVRAAVAHAKPGERREAILLALSADADPAARRNACEALAAFPSEASALALVSRFGDADRFVRAAAEASFGKVKPSEAVLAKAEALLDDKAAKASAVTALGLAGDVAASSKLLAILDSRPDDELAIRAIDSLRLLDFKAASKSACSFASSPNPKLRRAVAAALGVLKESDSFDVLRKLAKDSDTSVACEALKSCGLIGGASFEPTLGEVLSDLKAEPARRAAAAWAASRSDLKDQKLFNQLKTLAIVACIPVPMSPEKAFDGYDVRASALMALSALGSRGSEGAAKAFDACQEAFKAPFAKMPSKANPPLLDPLMEEYLRQIDALRKGESPAAAEVPSVEPELSLRRI